MNFEIKEVKNLSGEKAHIYSVILDGDSKTLLEQFFDENAKYRRDVKKILNKILVMANDTGCRRQYFKEGEGALGDGVVAIDKTGCLRLYGIYFHNAVVLFGSGGYKPPGVVAYQDYAPLNAKAQQVKKIAKIINQMIIDKELIINEDGTLNIY